MLPASQSGGQPDAGRCLESSRWSLPPESIVFIVVTALPLYHIFALTACFLFGVHSGGLCLLIPNPRDIAGLIRELSNTK